MSANVTRRDYDLTQCIRTVQYRSLIRALRGRKRDRRRRSLIAAIARAHAASGAGEITGVEVGVNFGATAVYLLEECAFLARLMLVDPWLPFADDHPDRQHHAYARRQPERWQRVMNLALDRLPPFGGRAVVSRSTSLEAAATCAAIGERHWFVYLDGSHAGEDVANDCRAWWPLVAAGGLLCGDDYQALENRRGDDQRDDVSRAVDAFALDIGSPIVHLCRNWFIQKPR